MVRRLLALTIVAAAILAAWSLTPDRALAGNHHRTSPDLFYNYYVPPGGCGSVGTQLYVSPRPTPPLVGHTYVTYQPLMPHEFLYPHKRTYLRRNPQGGWTRTSVQWKKAGFDFSWFHDPPKIVVQRTVFDRIPPNNW